MHPDDVSLAIAGKDSQYPDLVLGGGGSRAILAVSGVLLACHLAGLRKWRTISGVSAGAIAGVMLASGLSAVELVHKVVEIDFSRQFKPRVNLLRVWWAFFLKNCHWKTRRTRGALNSEALGKFVQDNVSAWPENFWTVAVAGNDWWLFTHQGVFVLKPDGGVKLISPPAPIDLAIRATCAVPGVIDGIDFLGASLLDGGLAVGRCPTALAKRYINAKPGGIIACDVGPEDQSPPNNVFLRLLLRLTCGECCSPPAEFPVDADGVLLIEPPPAKVKTLDFKLTSDQKWEVIMSGFTAAVDKFAAAGLISGDQLGKAREIVAAAQRIAATSLLKDEYSKRIQGLLAANGLY